MMNQRAKALIENRWGFILFMSAMCALSPFAMSIPVPALPSVSVYFDKPVSEIQFLVSVFIIGLGIAQPVHGFLSDQFGRRPVLLIGFAIFITASLASVFMTSWTALAVCRFLQAVGVSAGTVVSRAIVNDVQPREDAAISLAYISIAMGVGPIVAPVIGALLDISFGWRSIFAACTVFGGIIFIMALARLPETRPRLAANSKSLKGLLGGYKVLLTSPQFIGYTMMYGFGQGVFFAYLPIAPDYFANALGESSSVFIASWIALSLSFMAGSLAGTRVTRRFGIFRSVLWASIWLGFALAAIAGSYAVFGDGVWVATLPLMLAMLGTGLICPLALAGSISVDPKYAGTASGLSSSLGLVLGGLFTVVSGKVYDETLWPYICLAVIAVVCNLLAALMTRPLKGH